MTQEDKELLIKDLCARLPYGVKLQKTYDTSDPVELYLIDLCHHTIKFYTYKGEGLTMCDVGNIERFGKLRYKPYLFPLSSMTEEQKMEIKSLCDGTEIFDDGSWMSYISILGNFNFEINLAVVNWLNANNFDYRGLIPKGLAIDATGLNIY